MSGMTPFEALPTPPVPVPSGIPTKIPVPGASNLPTEMPKPPVDLPGLPDAPSVPDPTKVADPVALINDLLKTVDFLFNLVTYAVGAVLLCVVLLVVTVLFTVLPIGRRGK